MLVLTGVEIWRRYHGDIVANVIGQKAGVYSVAVWHEPSGTVEQLSRLFVRADSAKAAADDLVRRVFSHACSVESCRQWVIWSTR
jgi:hypothetical protein